MFQIVGCSLESALKSYCGRDGQQLAKKVEFKKEIIFVLNNYANRPEILKPGVKTDITERKWVQSGANKKNKPMFT